MQEESDEPVPPPPVRFPGDGLPPNEIFPACKPDEPVVQTLSPEENQRVNESLRRAMEKHQLQQRGPSKLEKFQEKSAETVSEIVMGLFGCALSIGVAGTVLFLVIKVAGFWLKVFS